MISALVLSLAFTSSANDNINDPEPEPEPEPEPKRKSGLTDMDRRLLSQRVTYGFPKDASEEMFRFGFSKYMEHAWPHDELLPLTCTAGDRYGQYMTTLVDALPAAFLFMSDAELTDLVATKLISLDFNRDVNVSVFETNIRILGGLVSTYLLAEEKGYLTPELRSFVLSKAVDIADRLMPAFDTPTGMPYGTVNLMHGVPPKETTVTCTAGVGTFIMEFGALSRITNDPKYEVAARRALRSLWKYKSGLGLFGNHIDIRTGHWVAHGSSVGTYTDSFYEYLVKASFLFNDPELQCMAVEAMNAAAAYLKHDGWLSSVNMNTGTRTEHRTDSMAAFWPGLLVLDGDVDSALQLADNICKMWDKYGFTAEFWAVPSLQVEDRFSAYPLRPELIESLFYLSWAKRPLFSNDKIQNFGYKMLKSIQTHCRVPCGYSGVNWK